MPGRKRARTEPEVVESQFDTQHSDQPAQEDQEATERGSKTRGRGQTGKAHKHRSADSVVEGGQDEYRGEPPEGYFTVAPGKQQGGKR